VRHLLFFCNVLKQDPDPFSFFSFLLRAIGRDPEYFPDPEQFNPQRWLTEDGKIKEELKSFPFGFGRRVCPGQYMATA
jgi:cytochrome P450